MTDRQIGAVMVLKMQALGLMFVTVCSSFRHGLRHDWGWMVAELLGLFILWVSYWVASSALRVPRPVPPPVVSDPFADFEDIVKPLREDRP